MKTEQSAMTVEDRLIVLVRTMRVGRTELDWAEFLLWKIIIGD